MRDSAKKIQIMGDDIFVTNPKVIKQAIAKLGNSSLIKLNQIGTVTETVEAVDLVRTAKLDGGFLPSLRRNRGYDDRRYGGESVYRHDQDRIGIAL